MTSTSKTVGVVIFFILIVIALEPLFYHLASKTFESIPSVTQNSELDKSTGQSAPVPVYVVDYTSDGFVPKELTIPIHARVAFRNQADTPLWAASDPHPTHTDYPAFDAQKDFNKNTVYEFTFGQSGTFSYHNHKNHSHRAFIHVLDPEHAQLQINKTPVGKEGARDMLLSMLKPNDPDSIFEVIDAIQNDSVLKLNCHEIAHDIGHRAYSLYGFSEAMTFNNPKHVDHPLVQYICAGGYMHGILEELSLNKPDFLKDPDTICAALPEADTASCYHGVGHVFMLARARNVDESIQDCRLIENTNNMYRCFEGMRMEQFWGNTEHVASSSLGWDSNDPLAPCIASQADEKPTCFLYSTFGYLRFHPKDYFGAINMCTNSGLPESDAEFCLKGLGITMMSKFHGQDLEGSEHYVAGLPTEQRINFYRGVLGYAHLSGVNKDELRTTCAQFVSDSLLCYQVLSEIY